MSGGCRSGGRGKPQGCRFAVCSVDLSPYSPSPVIPTAPDATPGLLPRVLANGHGLTAAFRSRVAVDARSGLAANGHGLTAAFGRALLQQRVTHRARSDQPEGECSMEALFGHPILQSLLAGILSWISVSLGASAIFLRREFSRLAMDCMLGAAGGMMLGAAFLGLLQPAAEMASHMGRLHFIPIVCGLMAGAAFLMGLDHLLPHLHIRQKQQEGLSTSWRRSVLLVTAMALHHIPEGLTMGVGYGAVAAGSTLPSGVALEMSSAFMVTGTTLLQNLPEGLVVATALRAEGFSAKRSWLCGVFSGCTAPIGAILGAVASQVAGSLLPFALAAAAGAMVYVVIEEVIPEANASGNGNAATVACIGGLCLVMSFSSLVG